MEWDPATTPAVSTLAGDSSTSSSSSISTVTRGSRDCSCWPPWTPGTRSRCSGCDSDSTSSSKSRERSYSFWMCCSSHFWKYISIIRPEKVVLVGSFSPCDSPVSAGDVLGVSPGEGHVLDVCGVGEAQTVVHPREGLVSEVHQVLVPHSDVPLSRQQILQLAVLQHPPALEGGVPQRVAPRTRPLGYGGDHGPRVPHQVDHLHLRVLHPGLQPAQSQPDGLYDPRVGLLTAEPTLC